jgi:hypothetical protein
MVVLIKIKLPEPAPALVLQVYLLIQLLIDVFNIAQLAGIDNQLGQVQDFV